MAVHDFKCRSCGAVTKDVNVPITIGARKWAETNHCRWLVSEIEEEGPWWHSCLGVLEPIPGIGRMSAPGAGGFSPFTLPVEDPASPTGFRDVTVSTLADIRKLERSSEQAERNGEGRRMVWRDYNQDVSNRDVHTLGADPSLKPSKFYSNGQRVVVRRGDPVVADHGEVPSIPDPSAHPEVPRG